MGGYRATRRLLDSFLSYRVKQYARASPFEVNLYSHAMVDLSPLREVLSYQPLVIHDAKAATKDLPLQRTEAHPVVGTQLLSLHFEPVSDTLVNLVITGAGGLETSLM